jgi:hypothetical protein
VQGQNSDTMYSICMYNILSRISILYKVGTVRCGLWCRRKWDKIVTFFAYRIVPLAALWGVPNAYPAREVH